MKELISQNITLQFVLHAPKLTCYLLSVNKLSKDSNRCVVFFDSHCEFQDRNSGKTIGSARMVNGLYYFYDDFSGNKTTQDYGSSISSISARKQIIF